MTLAGGLTTTGFVALTQDEIVQNLNANTLANINAALDLAPDQPIGQIWGIASAQLAQAWEAIATIYNALNPNAAEGALLASACALTGTVPQAATYSKVTVTLNLNAGATVHAGWTAYVAGQPTNTWVLLADVTNSTGATANFTATFRSNLPGPFAANAGTLTGMSVATIGLNSITNAASATPGNPADTDTSLRARRAIELSGQGNGDIDSIRAHVLQIPGVLSAIVTENASFAIAFDGTPGKAFHVIIWDGPSLAAPNNTVAQAIWSSKPAGIASFGNVSGVAVDALGNNQTVSFDRAAQQPIFLQVTTTPATLTPTATLGIKNAILAYTNGTFDASGNELTAPAVGLGQTVIALGIRGAALSSGLVTDVPALTLNTGGYGPGTANIAIVATQIATFSITNIQVNGV